MTTYLIRDRATDIVFAGAASLGNALIEAAAFYAMDPRDFLKLRLKNIVVERAPIEPCILAVS